MRRSVITTVILALSLSLIVGSIAIAQDPEALAKESEAYCKTTAKDAPTQPEAIVARVEAACAVLSSEGTAAFPKFKGDGSEFLFDGTYIWIHSLDDATMLMHPIKYKMEGNKYIGLKDKKGKRFFVAMNKLVKAQESGWVEYFWPKPGTDEIVRKISYVKGCKTADGVDVVLGCGIYNGDEAALAALEIN